MPHPTYSSKISIVASEINDPKHWRARAADMRALSNMVEDPGVAATMLRQANDYDKLADQIARRDEAIAGMPELPRSMLN